MLDFGELWRLVALCVDDSVHAEVAVVLLVVVSAVGKVAQTFSVRTDSVGLLPHSLVDPIPDATAGKRRRLVELIPSLLERAKRVAHAMGILEEKRALARKAALPDGCDRRIARTVNLEPFAVLAISRGTRIVKLAAFSLHDVEVRPLPRLVAPAPHEDTWRVAPVYDHIAASVDVSLCPARA